MTIDVIIPTYNRAQLLWACVQSIFNAEVPDGLRVRVVVVDNNSSDGTREVCKCLASMPPFKFSYLFVETPGKSAALNAAIEQSDADLIGMIDDDELLDKNWFNVVYREFTDSELMFLGGQYLPNYECEPPKWIPDQYKAVIGIVLREKVERYGTECKGIMMGGNAVVRRFALMNVLPYPEHLGRIGDSILLSGEDEVIFHRLLKIGYKGISHPDLIIRHWIPKQRMSKKYYRHWVFGNGAASAFRQRESVAYTLGVPRYKLRYLLNYLTHPLDFVSQLHAIECIGSIYGAWLTFKTGMEQGPPE